MPRPDFFGEVNGKYRSTECREGRHADCPLEALVGDPVAYPPKIKPCTCVCHDDPNFIPSARD